MIETIVVRGHENKKLEGVLVRSQYDVGKAFPIWDTDPMAKAGWWVCSFSILYPEERAKLQETEGIFYFSRQADLESWFNGT